MVAIVVFMECLGNRVFIYEWTALAEFEVALADLQFLDLGIKS
jgi:hypothetical protein